MICNISIQIFVEQNFNIVLSFDFFSISNVSKYFKHNCIKYNSFFFVNFIILIRLNFVAIAF